MSKLDELKTQLEALTDRFTEPEDLKAVGAISATINAIEAENKSAQENYQSLFKDYRDLVKAQSFSMEGKNIDSVCEPKEINIEDFFK